MVKRIAASLAAVAMTSSFALITVIDQQHNITGRVIDGTIFELVDETNPMTSPMTGEAYDPVVVRAARETQSVMLRRHCDFHLKTIGEDASVCWE